ncbi:MAG: hypothetical protein V2A54_12430 [Bacteroidota bacterium]
MKRITFIFIFTFCFVSLQAQVKYERSGSFLLQNEKNVYCDYENFHTAIQPFNDSLIQKFKPDEKPFDDFFTHSKNLSNFIFPQISLNDKYSIENSTNHLNYSVGLLGDYTLKKRFSFSGNVAFTQFDPVSSVDSFMHRRHVVPGVGWAGKNKSVYTLPDWRFRAGYQMKGPFYFEAGNASHFIGDGYRSLFLSENAANYPYFKVVTTALKFRYMNLWTMMTNVQSNDGKTYAYWRKMNVFHYLSWNITRNINVGFFESIVAATKDSVSHPMDVSLLNPVIFLQPVNFNNGSPHNALLGGAFKIRLLKKNILYGQLLIDDMITSQIKNDIKHFIHPSDTNIQYGYWTNKQALQLGMRIFEPLGLKKFSLLTEVNMARPYTYSHLSTLKNYSHMQQSIAHPLGSNFTESMTVLRYQYKRWFFELEAMIASVGIDTGKTHYGQDIFQTTFDSYITGTNNIPVQQFHNTILQGVRTDIKRLTLKASWLLDARMNLFISAGCTYRSQNNFLSNQKDFYFFISLGNVIKAMSEDNL